MPHDTDPFCLDLESFLPPPEDPLGPFRSALLGALIGGVVWAGLGLVLWLCVR